VREGVGINYNLSVYSIKYYIPILGGIEMEKVGQEPRQEISIRNFVADILIRTN
jgi:hypothetical protein